MKNMDSIPKTNPHKVPEGYFEILPMVILKRIESTAGAEDTSNFLYVLKFALPLLLILVLTLTLLRPKTPTTVEELLRTVSTEQLVTFLEESNLNTDGFLFDWNVLEPEIERIEQEVFQPFEFSMDDLELYDDNFEY